MCVCVARCLHICVTGHITRGVLVVCYMCVFQARCILVCSKVCYRRLLAVCVTRSVLQVLLACYICVLPVCTGVTVVCYRCVLEVYVCVLQVCTGVFV